jgi:hypothetical protein
MHHHHLTIGYLWPWLAVVLAVLLVGDAFRRHHIRRLVISAAVGIGSAVIVVVGVGMWHHRQLAAHTAAAHTTAGHVLLFAAIVISILVTVIVYVIATVRARGGDFGGGGFGGSGGGRRFGRRPRIQPPPYRPMLPPGTGGGIYPGDGF